MKQIFNFLKVLIIGSIFLLSNPVYAQFPIVRVDEPSNTQAEEVSISINPTDPDYIAAGSNIYFFYFTGNGGMNWNQSAMKSPLGVWGDPCLLYDGLGNLYYSHLSWPPAGDPPTQGYWIDRIVIQKSTNNGLTWTDGVGVGFNSPKNQDKEWMAADLSSANFKNNLYMAWTEFDEYGSHDPLDRSRILFSRSTNQSDSWSNTGVISDSTGNCVDEDSTVEGAVPCVGPNGEVYLSWSGPSGIKFDKSTDGGATFGEDIFVIQQIGGWAFNIPGIGRANGLPVTICDTSNSPYRGNIYILWGDLRNGNADVFLIRSTDKGETWGNVIKVNDDNTNRHQFFPWMAIDQTTGFLYVIFYDRRNTIGNATDVYLARSTDGSDNFTNFKISDSSFVPSDSVFFGDYSNIAAANGKIYPIWMRMDNGNLSVWTALINESDLTDASDSKQVISNYYLYQNYPNPFNPSTIISWRLPVNSHVLLKVYDILGNEITTLVNERKPAGNYKILFDSNELDLSSGIYFYKLNAGDFTQEKKMVLLR